MRDRRMESTFSTEHLPIQVRLPEGVRCVIALSYDTDTAGGYAPDGVCHGRTPPFLHEYMLRLCDTAEQYSVTLHFFQIGNGLEEPRVVEYLKEILRRGHIIDSHTYSHLALTTDDVTRLDDELVLTNELFKERLGWQSTVLRGPGGYARGLDGLKANQEVILNNGFQWVSGRYSHRLYGQDQQFAIEASKREPVYAYPTGLIEIPVQGYTDRTWFDGIKCIDPQTYGAWRVAHGHQPVPDGWCCPWTAPDALDEWIGYNLSAADFAYENRLLWIPVWHPYSHYLHDPDNRMLPALLQHCAAKPERVLVCTVRDAAQMLLP